MRKKSLSVLLVLAIGLSLLPVGALAEVPTTDVASKFAGGTGTERDPYRIQTAEQLADLAKSTNEGTSYEGQYFSLKADIDLGSEAWEPIGKDESNSFKGVFYGNNHTISNLSVDNYISDNQGLFGCAYEAIIQDLRLENAVVIGKENVGGIVGYMNGTLSECTLSNCSVTGKSTISGAANVGGIVGKLFKGTIAGSSNEANVTATREYAGGISGYVYSGEIMRCVNHGVINGNGTNGAGGISGHGFMDSISDCFNTGGVSGNQVGGIAGEAKTIVNCGNIGSVQGSSQTGGIAGNLPLTGGSINYCWNGGDLSGSQIGHIVSKAQNSTISSCYWPKDGDYDYIYEEPSPEFKNTTNAIYSIALDTMKTAGFAETLNKNLDSPGYKTWSQSPGKYRGFPYFEIVTETGSEPPVDETPSPIVHVGYKADGGAARETINRQVNSTLNPENTYDAYACDDDTMWAIFKAGDESGVEAGQTYRVIAAYGGDTIATGPETQIKETSKGGIMYFTFNREDHVGSKKLREGVYTFTLQCKKDGGWVDVGGSKELAVYRVTVNASGATNTYTDYYAMLDDVADPSPKPTHKDGLDFKGWESSTSGYVVTYTAKWNDPKDPDSGDSTDPGGTGGSGGAGGAGGTGGSGGTGGAGGSGSTGGSGNEDAYAIWIDCGRHGTAYANYTSAEPGTRVVVTVNPDSDYILDEITFERGDGRSLSWSQSGKRYTFTMPASDVTVYVEFAFIAAYSTFIPPQSQTAAQTSVPAPAFTPVTWRPAAAMQDVPANSWSYPAAQWAYQNGYLDTAADGTFRLNDTVSHLQMWRIMARWLGESAIDDGSVSRWASRSGAARIGAASGVMTRQNMVEYLYQCYFLMGGDVSAAGNLIQYRDSQQITSTSAKNAWIWAVNKGIISGTPGGYLNPGGTLSRGEFASILMRLCRG